MGLLTKDQFDNGQRLRKTIKRYKRDKLNVQTKKEMTFKTALRLRGEAKRLEAEALRMEKEVTAHENEEAKIDGMIEVLEILLD